MSPLKPGAVPKLEIPDAREKFGQWEAMMASMTPSPLQPVTRQVMEAGRAYLSLAAQAQSAGQEGGSPVDGWVAAMEKHFGDWRSQLEQGAGKLGLDPSVLAGNPFVFWQQLLDGKGVEQLPAPLSTLVQNYQQQAREFFKAFSTQGQEAVETLRKNLNQMAEQGKGVKSINELYKLWVGTSEQVFGRFAQTDQYQSLYGNMVNAMSELRAGINGFMEQQYHAANLPTRSELDELAGKQQELVRENRALREQLGSLNATLQQVQGALEALRAGVTAVVPAPASTVAEAVAEKAMDAKTGKPVEQPEPAPVAAEPQKQDNVAARDDLGQIHGIGPKTIERLWDAGIQTFEQLAALSPAQALELDHSLDAKGRVIREDWVGQAMKLAAASRLV
ncbi:MAG: hypothetical protein KDI44_17620 [Thiothrix sp.]|nr:hypothetical protein [Thiothrix sp.]